MADRLLDSNLNHNLKRLLRVASWVNPLAFFPLQIYFGNKTNISGLLSVLNVSSISMFAIVSVSGWIFRKTMLNYIQGQLIMRVASL